MDKGAGSLPVLTRYTLLQLPGIALAILVSTLLRKWFQIPLWTCWAIALLWVLKDAVLYPFVWRAYDARSKEGHEFVGLSGKAGERLDPSGYIFVKGETWKAVLEKGSPAVEKGEEVKVVAREGLTLVVQAEKDS
jgi:membrane-bound ClpP family serine protease